MEQLTFWPGEHHAKVSALQGTEKVLTTSAVSSCCTLRDLHMKFGRSGFSGKTSPAAYHRQEGKISRRSFLACLAGTCLSPKKDGATAAPSRMRTDATVLLGEHLTLNMSEFNDTLAPYPSEEGVCGLSEILEDGAVPSKYYLSGRACLGILRRAERRGKKLPDVLRAALIAQSRSSRG